MDLFNFYLTLGVLLFSGMASSACVSGYIISRRKSFIFAATMFLFYFFDVSIVFFHGYVAEPSEIAANPYAIQFPALSIITGAGTFGAFWLYICEKLRKYVPKNKIFHVIPIVAYIVLAALMYLFVAEPQMKCFFFFSTRQVFLFFIFIVYFIYYAFADEHDRPKIRPRPGNMAIASLLSVGIFVEDIFVMFYFEPLAESLAGYSPIFSAERNPFENLLLIWLGIMLVHDSWRTVEAHYRNPPDPTKDASAHTLETMLPRYADLHELTGREREVLYLILLGKDNQNIATELTLTKGTVKVHVHNILRKTGQANRRDLTQDFWKMR